MAPRHRVMPDREPWRRRHEDDANRCIERWGPEASGPYSQAIVAGDMVFCSGMAGIDPATGDAAEGIEAQTEQALRNLAAVLDAAGCSMDDVVKTTIFYADVEDFGAPQRGVRPPYARPSAGAVGSSARSAAPGAARLDRSDRDAPSPRGVTETGRRTVDHYHHHRLHRRATLPDRRRSATGSPLPLRLAAPGAAVLSAPWPPARWLLVRGFGGLRILILVVSPSADNDVAFFHQDCCGASFAALAPRGLARVALAGVAGPREGLARRDAQNPALGRSHDRPAKALVCQYPGDLPCRHVRAKGLRAGLRDIPHRAV